MSLRYIIVILFVAQAYAQAQFLIAGKQFTRSVAEAGAKGEWVLYERGAPQTPESRRWLTRRVLVKSNSRAVNNALRSFTGASSVTQHGEYCVIEFGGSPDAALKGAAKLRQVPGVILAEPMLARQWQRRAQPTDPLFGYSAGNPGYQWHLHNTGQNNGVSGADIDVLSAWDEYRGTGVRIAIVDDGLEVTHPDLIDNVDVTHGHDFNDGDDDPSPGPDDSHGTACAGVAAARWNNGIGISGVAPEATLVGLRLIAAPTTDEDEAEAFSYLNDIIAVKSNSWGPFDNAYGTGGPGPLSAAALAEAATHGRGGKGTVFLWAAGNGNYSGDDSNYDGWANSPYAIAVSAINDRGKQAWYSEPGANILICAPSSGGKQGITTTDRSGPRGYNEESGTIEYPDYSDTAYTNTFGGTSSAAPAVAGVVALMLQANPTLTYRDIQEILVRTAQKNDEFDGGWVTNGAGYHFNIQYGAGLVDASAACSLAVGWSNVEPQQSRTMVDTNLALAIPDAEKTGVTHSFSVDASDNLRLEHVAVRVKVTHPYRGNLEYRLVSPSGVDVRLARSRFNDNGADLEWTFMTTHFWGERSQGDWTLRVVDHSVDDVGTLEEAAITFYGTPASAGVPLPVFTSDSIMVGRVGAEFRYQISASNFTTSYDVWGLPAGLIINTSTGMITGTPPGSGTFYATRVATNATGSSLDNAIFYFLPAAPSLSSAVEQPSETQIVPFGYSDWFLQSATTHDASDAAQSGAVGHEEYSGIEFTATGPARLSYHWKVSSEKNYDYLVLVVDDEVRDYITGEVDWTEVVTYLGPGPHNVDIYYIKDQEIAKGQDAGWVDELQIVPTNEVPTIVAETIVAYQNTYFRNYVEATHAPDSYSAMGLPPGLSMHAKSGLIYGKVAATGSYPVTIGATNSFGASTSTIVIQVDTVEQGLADAVDAASRAFTTPAPVAWVPQVLYARDGEDAARSGPTGNDQQSVMTTEVTGPCKVIFYWGVSSEEDYDFLRFLIDDVEQSAISGEVGWKRVGFLVPEGLHTLKWTYQKDEFTASGLDSGFVDSFSVSLDNDADGYHADMEDYFGTSDNDPNSRPIATLEVHPSPAVLRFPSVPGQDYLIEYSKDLTNWTATTVTATSELTTWTDLNAASRSLRFYRIGIP
ncbi:MAG: S8 family serine peptidase [Roseimicrobium sp.]